jgi:hypothetical protein
MMRLALVALACLSAFPGQAIEKCILPDGRVLYSDTPCPADAQRKGVVTPLPSLSPEAEQRAFDDRARLQRELDRLERREAARDRADSQARAAAREDARRNEELDLKRRETEALERLAAEQARPAIVVSPPGYRHHRPPVLAPKPPPKAEEEPRRQMAPFPRKRAEP